MEDDNHTPDENPNQAAAAEAEAREDAELLKFAAEADANLSAGKPSPEFKEKTADQTPAATGTEPAKGKDGKPADKGEADPGKKPGDKAADGTEGKPGDKKEDGKGKTEGSAYDKAKKEEARQKEVLAGFQKEKEQLRGDNARLQAEVTNLRREMEELRKQPTGPAKDNHGLTAEDYDQLAKDYKEKGRDDLAKAAEERAGDLRKQSTARTGGAAMDFRSPDFQRDWQRNVQQLIASDPELGKPDNPVVRAANILVNHQDYGHFFRSRPDGIMAAVEVARIMQAGEASKAELATTKTALETANTELAKVKAEVERLTNLMQPNGSHPSKPAPGEKKPEDMDDEEIMAVARAADRGLPG